MNWSEDETVGASVENYIPENSLFHGTIHETRCPSPWLLGHVERELDVAVRRRLLVHSVRRKVVDRRALAGVPTIQKNTQRTGRSSKNHTMFGGRGRGFDKSSGNVARPRGQARPTR